MTLLDLKIVTDTAARLVVQTQPSNIAGYVIVSIIFVVISLAAWQLRRRSTGFALGIFTLVSILFIWTVASLWTTGGVVDQFTMDRVTNQFVVESFYPRTHTPESPPRVRQLDQVLRADLEEPRHGSSSIVVSMKTGERIYPVGHGDIHTRTDFAVFGKMQSFCPEHGR